MLQKVFAGVCTACCAGSLIMAGCSAKLPAAAGFTIFYSNDVRGEFENCGCDDVQLGGLSRKALLLRAAARKTANLMRLDAGNLFFQKKPLNDIEARESILKAGFIIDAYNAMGCDALNVSDGDFIMGFEVLAKLRSKASFPFVSSNIVSRSGGQPIFEPYLLKTVAGTRLAILGVCPQDAVFVPDLSIEDPAAAVRKIAAAVRRTSDFIVVLSGLGLERDRELARQAPGINLIISSHADRVLDTAVVENGVAIVQAYNRGQYLGSVQVARIDGGFTLDSRLIALKPGIGEAQDITDMGRVLKAQVAAINQQAFFKGQPEQAGAGGNGAAYVGGDSCVQCHVPQYENWQATSHARAHQTLVDKGSQYSVECLVCHTTGYGETGGGSPSQKERSVMINVQCESCHGPGSRHADSTYGIVRGGRQVCLGCHTEKNSPRFDYDAYLMQVKCPVSNKKQTAGWR